jgi:hypothetical protein
MRKFIFSLFLTSLFFVNASSQNVGIGTMNPQNKLHVAGGLRLDTLVGIGGSGLLQHNSNGVVYGTKFTGSVTDFLKGDGSFGSMSSAGWSLTGNTGIDPIAHFIGTTDAQPLIFKVNNLPAGQIHHSNNNTGFGLKTLMSNTTGIGNSFFGASAGQNNTTGFSNSIFGYQSLYSNTIGFSNSAIGSFTLYSNTSGANNTALGFTALYSNTTGSSNTATGWRAMYNNTTGNANTATGIRALFSNSSGTFNSAYGFDVLLNNTTGTNNVANGYTSLYSNTTGSYNVSVGAQSLFSNTTGYNNTAVGFEALKSNSIATNNNALGAFALQYNTTGSANTAIGVNAMHYNTLGQFNTATGNAALYNNTLGIYNTATGVSALESNTEGDSCTAVGIKALSGNTTGIGNTGLGSGANVSTGNLYNATAIGYKTVVNASNKIRLGNSAVTVIEGQVAYTFPSDGRFKTNVNETVKGLDFIMKLRPVIYNFQTKKYEEFMKREMISDVEFISSIDYSESEKIRHNGFIAQEVEKAANESGYDFDGVVSPKDSKEAYGLSYSQFVVPLVKSVQEQQAIIEKQQKQIDVLIQELKMFKEKK